MKRRLLSLLICLVAVCGVGQTPSTVRLVALNGSNFNYANLDSSGNLMTASGTATPVQVTGYIPPMAMTALNTTTGKFEYVHIDSNGNILTTGGGGGSTSPGGANGQCQYNNSGAFGGDSGCSTDGVGHLILAGLSIQGSANAGYIALGQGTLHAPPVNSILDIAPTSVPVAYTVVEPSGPPTGSNIVKNCTAANPSICSWAPSGSGSGALVQIAQTIVSSATPSITFSSIPGTFTNLRLIFSGQVDGSATDMTIQFNADASSDYNWIQALVVPPSAPGVPSFGNNATEMHISILSPSSGAPASTSGECMIPAYSKIVMGKNVNCYYSVTNGSLVLGTNIGDWSGTSAVTSMKIAAASGNFVTGTIMTLYGVQ